MNVEFLILKYFLQIDIISEFGQFLLRTNFIYFYESICLLENIVVGIIPLFFNRKFFLFETKYFGIDFVGFDGN